MKALRDPATGCPWDVEQDFASIAPYTIEEAYEVADAIGRGDMAALRDELGDLLLQVVFHARMAEEAGHFGFADVAAAISTKLVRRHPHVFAEATVPGAAAQRDAWEAIKVLERGDLGVLEGVAAALPALSRAAKLGSRAARVGFDWPDASGARAKVLEELSEIDAARSDAEKMDEIGDLLFASVNLARHLQVDAEQALRAATDKFERRFRYMEDVVETGLENLELDEFERYWQQAKTALTSRT
jgi:ATP diphosphatase